MTQTNDGNLAVVFSAGIDQEEAGAILAEYDLEPEKWLRHEIAAKVSVPPEETQIWIDRLSSDDRIDSATRTTRVIKRPDLT